MFVVLVQSPLTPTPRAYGPFRSTLEAGDFGTELTALSGESYRTLRLDPVPETFAHEPGL